MGQMGVLQPLVPLGNSGTVSRGQRGSNPPWSVLGLGFNERVLGFAWYLTSVCFLLIVGEKGVSQKFCYVRIFCLVYEPQGIFAVFFRCPVEGGNRGFLQCS